MDGVFDEQGDGGVALGSNGDDAAGAGGDLLDVGEGFSYLRTLVGSEGSLVAIHTTGKDSSMRALGRA